MRFLRAFACAALVLAVFSTVELLAQPANGSDVPTFRSTSSLVFLDVTVLDKKGRPVVSGLSKADFSITEDKRPQRIFSFEAPEEHTSVAGEDNPDGKAPVTIFVLDLLNSRFEDFAFIRYSVKKYLDSQPEELDSPAELMVVGNRTLEMLQGFTRNKRDLLFALEHLPPVLPYKIMNGSFYAERFNQSIDALQQIALQNKGVPGRKNIVWVGHGGPNLSTMFMDSYVTEQVNRFMHLTTNMLVDARMSLFVIYPGLDVEGTVMSISAADATIKMGDKDPFAGDINFGVFVNETGGSLFFNRNDVDREMSRSQELGSRYYTLTYQPQNADSNGKFRRIRVTMRDPNLRAVTKTGYFAPEEHQSTDPRETSIQNIAEAVRSTIPFSALELQADEIVRHPDTESVEFTLRVRWHNLIWQKTEDQKQAAKLLVAIASVSGDQRVLASKMSQLTLIAFKDPALMTDHVSHIRLSVRVPRKTKSVRVVVGNEDGGRMGSTDLDRKAIDAAPALPTPEPQLSSSRAAKPGE